MIVDYAILLNYELLLANYSNMIFVSIGKYNLYLLTVMVMIVYDSTGCTCVTGVYFTYLKFLDIVFFSLFLCLLFFYI